MVAKIDLLSLTYVDPFQVPIESKRSKIVRSVAVFVAVAMLIAFAGLLAAFSDLLGELFKDQWKVVLQTWLTARPWWALITLVAISATLTGLILWLIDWLKDRNSL
jgi:hypothetical protein